MQGFAGTRSDLNDNMAVCYVDNLAMKISFGF